MTSVFHDIRLTFPGIDDIFIKKIFIKVDRLTDDIKNKIVSFSKLYRGYNSVYLYLDSEKKIVKLDFSFDISNKNLEMLLEDYFGKENIKID